MPDENPTRRPFAAWLQEQRNGALHAELTEQLTELVKSCTEHGKKGSLTLTVTVKPSDDGYHLFVTDDTKATLPRGERPSALYFSDEDGNLSRRDPRQQELPLRKIDGGKGEEVVPDAETGSEG